MPTVACYDSLDSALDQLVVQHVHIGSSSVGGMYPDGDLLRVLKQAQRDDPRGSMRVS